MTLKSDSQIKAAWITGICAIIAAILTAVIAWHPWSDKKSISNNATTTCFLSGAVVDAKSNESVSQAQISVIGRSEQTTTEQNGNFSLTLHDSLSSIRIRVTKIGFKTIDISSIVPNNNLIIQLTK